MEKGVFRVVLIAVLVSLAASAVLKIETKLPGHEFFNTLPETEQPDFLTFELGRGYTEKVSKNELNRLAAMGIVFPDSLDIAEELVMKFKSLERPENFTQNLFNFVQTEFDLDSTSIRTLILTRDVCFENGECININDLGSLCCPF